MIFSRKRFHEWKWDILTRNEKCSWWDFESSQCGRIKWFELEKMRWVKPTQSFKWMKMLINRKLASTSCLFWRGRRWNCDIKAAQIRHVESNAGWFWSVCSCSSEFIRQHFPSEPEMNPIKEKNHPPVLVLLSADTHNASHVHLIPWLLVPNKSLTTSCAAVFRHWLRFERLSVWRISRNVQTAVLKPRPSLKIHFPSGKQRLSHRLLRLSPDACLRLFKPLLPW